MKRVVIVYHTFAHYRAAVAEALTAEFRKRGIAVTYAADFSVDRFDGIPCLRVDYFHSIGADTLNLRNFWAGRFLVQRGLMGACIRAKTDTAWIFLGDAKYISTILCLLFLRFRRISTYLWTHGSLRPLAGLRGLVLRGVYGLADGLLLYSHRAEQLLRRANIEVPVKVIGNSLTSRNRLMPAGMVAQGEIDIAFSGRLTAAKRVDLIIRCLHRAARDGVLLRAVVIGDGPFRPDLERLAQELGVADQIEFMGELYGRRVQETISKARCFVIPSGAGLSVLEALAAGVPVITGDDPSCQKPEVEALVPGVNGAFFREGSVESLVSVVKYWRVRGAEPSTRRACIDSLHYLYTAEAQAERIFEFVVSR